MRNALFVIAILLSPSLSHAGFVDFYGGPPKDTPGAIHYDGSSSELIGKDINMPTVVGSGTPENDAVTLIFKQVLNFTTGTYIDDDGGKGWRFSSGGNINIVRDDGTVQMSGTFTGVTEVFQTADSFKIVGSSHFSKLGTGLANFFGLPNVAYDGGLSVLFNTDDKPGHIFYSSSIHAGALVSLDVGKGGSGSVPEPASVAMLGIGLAGASLAIARRRKY